jgi:hypothetical protein
MGLVPGKDFKFRFDPKLDHDFIVETPEFLALPETSDDIEVETKAQWISLFDPNGQPSVPMHRIPANSTMLDVLVIANIFSSKSEARKNWRGPVEIPWGFSERLVGKMKAQITIFKRSSIVPIPEPEPVTKIERA